MINQRRARAMEEFDMIVVGAGAAGVGVSAYRRETLAPCTAKEKPVVPAEELALAWRMLGMAVADHPERFITARDCRSRRHA